MSLQLNVLSLSLILPTVVSLLLALEALKPKYASRAKFFALLMFFIAGWSAAYGFELASSDFEGMVFWLKVEYFFIPFVPLMLYLVVRQYAGLKHDFKPKQLIYLLPIPVLTLLLSVTNDYHHLYYESVSIDRSATFPLLSLEIGIWYKVHLIYAYALVIAASVVLVRKLIFQRSLFRNQLIYMLIAVLIPMLLLSLYLFEIFPVDNLDPTPFAFTFSGLAMSVSILRYRMLDLMPIAREHVFTSMPDGLVVLDNKMRIIDANPGSMKIFSWDEIPFGALVENIWKPYPMLVDMLRELKSESIVMEVNKQKELFYYQISTSAIRDHKTQEVGYLVIIHDITVRYTMQEAIRQSEEKLKRLNAEKDKLFSVIAHDLRGPLGTFTGLTEMAMFQADDVSHEEKQQLATDMHKSAQALQNLLENLLYWSRMQREDVKIHTEKLRVKALLDENLVLFQNAISTKSLVIEKHFLEEAKVLADKQMLMTVLRNLLSNAIKFTPRNGKISLISKTENPGFLQIQVSDSGIGMDETILKNLFSIEDSMGRPGTEGEASSGLGLILSHEFIEKMNGRILVKSTPGKGSTFTVVLPAAT